MMCFLCSACSANFDDNHQRREHMREQWHVYNVKRRMASLPPISKTTYQSVLAPPARQDPPSDTEDLMDCSDPAEEDEDATDPEPSTAQNVLPSPEQCLFCLATAENVSENVQHMAASHGLVLPDLQNLQTDLETLVSYLGLVAVIYCECLYCGATKHSADAVRAHMLAKGHCMLDLEAGSEFLDFWEAETPKDEERGATPHSYQLLSKTEMRLSSGAVVTSRQEQNSSNQKRRSRVPREREPSQEVLDTPERPDQSGGEIMQRSPRQYGHPERPSRALAIRDQMGLTGLSDSQRRSLAISQRKIDLTALRSNNKAQWTLEKMGNKVKQKHFVVGSLCRSGIFLDPTMR